MKCESPAACRFFTLDQALQWTAAAYYGASRSLEPPPGEDWWIDGDPWATWDDFADQFHHLLTARINQAADEAGLPPSRVTGSVLCWGWSGSDTASFCGPENEPFAASENGRDNQAEKGVIRA